MNRTTAVIKNIMVDKQLKTSEKTASKMLCAIDFIWRIYLEDIYRNTNRGSRVLYYRTHTVFCVKQPWSCVMHSLVLSRYFWVVGSLSSSAYFIFLLFRTDMT